MEGGIHESEDCMCRMGGWDERGSGGECPDVETLEKNEGLRA